VDFYRAELRCYIGFRCKCGRRQMEATGAVAVVVVAAFEDVA